MDARVIDSRDKLVADFKVVLSDAEELLKATASQSGDKVAGLRAKLQDNVQVAKMRLAEAQQGVVDRTKVAAQVTDTYVHEHPWQSIGIAAAAGAVIGMLVNRR